MTIPSEIVEAVAREHFGAVEEYPGEKDSWNASARIWLGSVVKALAEHGYKITGPMVTEEMVEVYRQTAAMTVPEAAQADWTAMHEAAPATPWESET